MTRRRQSGGVSKRAHAGRRQDLDNRYFRSGWEANYARYLNWLIGLQQVASWEFEVDTFEFPVKRGSKFYTPDFKVRNLDGSFEYHEVKGWMDAESATKLRRMAKHYPSLKVVLIGGTEYRDIAKKVGGMIPHWE